jgi:deoxycytidine triphosphate deaminase
MKISKTLFDQFHKDWCNGLYAGQRYGQAFYNHFNLHKCNKTYNAKLDRLYNEQSHIDAQKQIHGMIDWEN